jgi:hypothetical protein
MLFLLSKLVARATVLGFKARKGHTTVKGSGRRLLFILRPLTV